MKSNGYDIVAVRCDVADFDSGARGGEHVQARSARSTSWSTTPASRAT